MIGFGAKLFWVLLLAVAGAAGQSSPSAKDTRASKDVGSITEEDYAIATAALIDVFQNGHPDKLLLINQTSIAVPPGMAAMTQFGGKAQSLLAQVPKEAKEQFDSRNQGRVKIDAVQLRTQFQIIALSPDEANKLVEGGSGWEPFREKYPNAAGITLFSLPGVSFDHTKALLYIGVSCDMLCGNGYFLLLGKEGDHWKVLQKVMIWVS